MSTATELAIRVLPGNRNHHLWNNNGTWFVHYTLHLEDYSKRRIRESLGTRCCTEARRRRDCLLRKVQAAGSRI